MESITIPVYASLGEWSQTQQLISTQPLHSFLLFLQLADNATNIVCGRWNPQANGLCEPLYIGSMYFP